MRKKFYLVLVLVLIAFAITIIIQFQKLELKEVAISNLSNKNDELEYKNADYKKPSYG